MRFAFISQEGASLALWTRIIDEGDDVLVYILERPHRKIGDNLVPKASSYDELVAWGKEAPSVFVFDSTSAGEKAALLSRQGELVVGGGRVCDRLEKDRAWSEKIAGTLGMLLPETHEFASIPDTAAWVKKHADDGSNWVFKSNKYLESSATYCGQSADDLIHYLEYIKTRFGSNISNIVQEKLEGIPLSTSCWWNGRSWLEPFMGTIEHKKFMDGDKGPSTGCSFNLVWPYPGYPKIAKELHFDALGEMLRMPEYAAPPGIYDVNALVTPGGKAYFLEFTPRFGYDSEPTSLMRGLEAPLGATFNALAEGRLAEMPLRRDEAWMSVRLSVPPYPWEHIEEEKLSAYGLPVRGTDGFHEGRFIAYGIAADDHDDIIVADYTGCIGLVSASGTSVPKMGKEIARFIEKLQIPSLQYRCDAADCITDDLEAIDAAGFGMDKVVRRGRTGTDG